MLNRLKLSSKFLIGIGVILVLFWCAFAAFLYTYLRNDLIKQSYEKTDILIGHIDSTSHYVQDVLRPRMFELLPQDVILKEAMSTTFINKTIMEAFNKEFPGYTFRRVSMDPINPVNMADSFEESFIKRFSDSGETHWKGTVKRKEEHNFVNIRAVPAEPDCFKCHRPLPEGSLLGIEYVSIPVDDALEAMKQITMAVFFMGLSGLVFLFTIINLYIETTVARPIKKVSSFFKSVVSGRRSPELEIKSHDEIGEMARSFNSMMEHLKESEDKLRASEKKYRNIFEDTKDAIIITDAEGNLQEMNPAGMELFPEGASTMKGLFVIPGDYERTIAEIEKGGFIKDFETSLRGRYDKSLEVLITANSRLEEGGGVCGYEYIIKDITERKWMEEQMRKSERLASVGKLAAGVAHEINNPLSVIMGYSRLLLREPLADNMKGDLETVMKNAESCKKIIEDLLHFSRYSKPSPVMSDLNALLVEVLGDLDNIFSKKGITIDKSLDDIMPEVFIDPGRIRQVLMNMLLNAAQAMPGGGKITVQTTYARKGRKALVSISDSGGGIREEDLSHIFDPFFTTKEGGTGLGLSVSYGIIKEHGGDIQVTSNDGRGTTFTIALPETAGVQ